MDIHSLNCARRYEHQFRYLRVHFDHALEQLYLHCHFEFREPTWLLDLPSHSY